MVNDWVITVPKTVDWATYALELKAAAEGALMNFHVRGFPKEMRVGDRMFIVHDGRVRGWMTITGLVERPGFRCDTTGMEWPRGRYVQRSGRFHPVSGPEMQGFRGVRRYTDG